MKENYYDYDDDYTEPSNSKSYITTIMAVSLFLFVGVLIMFKVAPILELFKASKYDRDENVEDENVEEIYNNRKKSNRIFKRNYRLRSSENPYKYVPHRFEFNPTIPYQESFNSSSDDYEYMSQPDTKVPKKPAERFERKYPAMNQQSATIKPLAIIPPMARVT